MPSFGHAAWFGIGAYAAALLAAMLARADAARPARRARCWPGLAAAPVRRVRGAAVGRLSRHADPGLRADRLGGRVPVGRRDRRRQRHPRRLAAAWAARRRRRSTGCRSRSASAATLLLRRVLYAPFGYALRAARDQPLRAEAIGLDPRRLRLAAFALAGAAAGLAGGAVRLRQGQRVPDLCQHPAFGRCAADGAAGRRADHGRPDRRRPRLYRLYDLLLRATDLWRLRCSAPRSCCWCWLFPEGIAGAGARVWCAAARHERCWRVEGLRKSFGGVHAVDWRVLRGRRRARCWR